MIHHVSDLIRSSLTESANLQSDIARGSVYVYPVYIFELQRRCGLELVSRKPRPYINSVIAGAFARA